MVDYSKIGACIKQYRTQKGLTQEALAEKVLVDYRHIAAIENGRRYPSLELVILIANALGVSADDLLADSLTHTTAKDDIHMILSDCTDVERKILFRCLDFMKNLFKEFSI